MKFWTDKFDAKIEAHLLAQRFRDRETELRQRIETLERDLAKSVRELREKKINSDTHMVSTLKHKAIAKEMVVVKAQFEDMKERLEEMEKSVQQVSLHDYLNFNH